MSKFLINKSVFGTEKHFFKNEEFFSWTEDLIDDIWHLDGSFKDKNCLDTLLKLNEVSFSLNPPEKYLKSSQLIFSNSNSLPWQWLMPQQEHRSWMKSIIAFVEEFLSTASTDYYNRVWNIGTNLLNSFSKAKIDAELWKNLADDAEIKNKAAINSFKPLQGGYSELIKYDRFGTRTGRLTVESGPHILNLKKEYRKLIQSRYKNGQIIYLDFNNLEPRIILYEQGLRVLNDDLYSFLNEILFDKKAERNLIKKTVLSQLYGMNKQYLSEKTGFSIENINKIQNYFSSSELTKKIKEEFLKKSFITNRYGRKILIDEPINKIFFNSYIQSSAADVSLLGFSQIIEKLKNKQITPLFLLTDALILDVHPNFIEDVKNIQAVNIDGYVQSFPVSFNQI